MSGDVSVRPTTTSTSTPSCLITQVEVEVTGHNFDLEVDQSTVASPESTSTLNRSGSVTAAAPQ